MNFNLFLNLRIIGILMFFISIINNADGQVANQVTESLKRIDSASVILSYKDTLSLDSFTDFDLLVRMKTGHKISAISLGLYYPTEYLQIDSVFLADNIQGFYSSDTNGLVIVAWSDVNPITIADEGTLLKLKMRTLDLKELVGTIKLGLYESSEFADQSANVIEGVELEVPEIQYQLPDSTDTLNMGYVRIGPNPFYNLLWIYFYLESDSKISISLSDFNGKEIYQSAEVAYQTGHHSFGLDASEFSSGIYYLKFISMNDLESRVKVFTVISTRK